MLQKRLPIGKRLSICFLIFSSKLRLIASQRGFGSQSVQCMNLQLLDALKTDILLKKISKHRTLRSNNWTILSHLMCRVCWLSFNHLYSEYSTQNLNRPIMKYSADSRAFLCIFFCNILLNLFRFRVSVHAPLLIVELDKNPFLAECVFQKCYPLLSYMQLRSLKLSSL